MYLWDTNILTHYVDGQATLREHYFEVVVFDQPCALALAQLQKQHRSYKRYTDMMIAATALDLNQAIIVFSAWERTRLACATS